MPAKVKNPPSNIKTGDLVSHKRYGFGRVVDTWGGNICDVLFKRDGFPFRHSCHYSYLLKVTLPE